MGTLIKYEFRKQLLSKIIVFLLAAVLEIFFLLGLLINNEDLLGIGIGFLILDSVVGLFYFSFECIITYSADLRTKQSYMLFLTPRNMFQIVGAKVITTMLQIIGAAMIFVGLMTANIFLYAAKNGTLTELLKVFRDYFKEFTGVEIRVAEILMVILMCVVTWLVFIIMAMFSITLSATLFANKKWRWLVSVSIFFFFNWLVKELAGLVMTKKLFEGEYILELKDGWCFILVYLIALVLDYFGTVLLLSKKVSV